MAEQLLFTINAPTNIKDDVVDILIGIDCITGFNLKKFKAIAKSTASLILPSK